MRIEYKTAFTVSVSLLLATSCTLLGIGCAKQRQPETDQDYEWRIIESVIYNDKAAQICARGPLEAGYRRKCADIQGLSDEQAKEKARSLLKELKEEVEAERLER